MIDWKKIDTVLLDMDGTLLDLNFDNHFWKLFVPQRYAEKHHITLTQAIQRLEPQFKALEGQLEWYCLDYWSDTLDLDIIGLKQEVAELINILPHVVDFLEVINQTHRRLFLVTNAHRDSLDLKMNRTCLQSFFDQIICSHDFGAPKEHQQFWMQLEKLHPFDKQTTLMIDDSLTVLKAARQYGIAHLLAVSKPDSKAERRQIEGFTAIEDFRELMPIV